MGEKGNWDRPRGQRKLMPADYERGIVPPERKPMQVPPSILTTTETPLAEVTSPKSIVELGAEHDDTTTAIDTNNEETNTDK